MRNLPKEIGQTIRFISACALAAWLLYGVYNLVTFQGPLVKWLSR